MECVITIMESILILASTSSCEIEGRNLMNIMVDDNCYRFTAPLQ